MAGRSKFRVTQVTNFYIGSAFTLLVGRQEGHPVCKKAGCWFVGGDILTGALHFVLQLPSLPPPPSPFSNKIQNGDILV